MQTTACETVTRAAGNPPIAQLSGFELERKIGEGNKTTVFLALHRRLRRRCALKVYYPTSNRHLGDLRRFEERSRALNALEHPSILPVHGAFDWQGAHCVAMAFAPFGSAKEMLARETILTEGAAASITAQVARGLAAAARIGILHRNIQPTNLLVVRRQCVQIADFALVRSSLDGCDSGQHRIVSAELPHAPAYTAPEVIAGHAGDHRSDLYSLGCVLFELLTGEPPHIAEHRVDLLAAHLTKTAPDLSDLVDPRLAAIVSRLLARDPEQRFESGDELASALKPFLSSTRFARGAVVREPPSGCEPRPIYARTTRRRPITERIAVPAELTARPVAAKPRTSTARLREAIRHLFVRVPPRSDTGA